MRGMRNLEIGLQQKKKLKKSECRQLELSLDGLSFTCGSSLQELNLPFPLDQVYLCSLRCFDPVEKLYF